MQFRHIIMTIVVAAVWGFNFIAIKIGLTEISPFVYGAGRFMIAALPALFIKKPANKNMMPYSVILRFIIKILGYSSFHL